MTGAVEPTPRLRVVMRSYGGENVKRRPAYYSKLLALASVVRAAAQVPGIDLVFLNDGPIPTDREAVMRQFGTLVAMPNGPSGMRSSYRAALDLPDRLGWSDDDVVAFSEDDYLYTEDAFALLAAAAKDLRGASYFSLYGEVPDYQDPASRSRYSLPRAWQAGPSLTASGTTWFNQPSTTSTFAARVGALRADRAIFEQCMRPFRRRFLDHETCLLYQGCVPYRGTELLTGLPDDFVPSVRGVVRTLVLAPYRLALNARARRQREPHLLYCATPNHATHMEEPVISPDRDWHSEAEGVAAWAEEQSLPEVAARIRRGTVAA